MEGDVEGLPGFFRERAETRTLTVMARTSGGGEWTDDAVEAAGRATEDFLRSLASPLVRAGVTCEHVCNDGETALRIRLVLEGTEAPLHEVATLTADMVGSMPGVEQSVSAVSWHISAPPSFEGSRPPMMVQ